MAQAAYHQDLMSLPDFLAWEREQPERWELINGYAYAMAGGTVASNRISKNISRAIDNTLLGSGCESFTENLKVVTPADDAMYPDVLVICRSIENKSTYVTSPIVVIEVLSDGTAKYDSGAKFLKYQTIPSLRHYVLVSQNECAVQHFVRRADGQWADYHALHKLEDTLELTAIDVSIPLSDIYERVLHLGNEVPGEPIDEEDSHR